MKPIREYIIRPLRDANQVQRRHLESHRPDDPDWEVIVVMTVSAIVLLAEHYGVPSLSDQFRSDDDPREKALAVRRTVWVSSTVLLYLVLPFLALRLCCRQTAVECGLGLGDSRRAISPAFLCYAVMAPLVYLVAHWPPFQRTYPLFQSGSLRAGNGLILWEIGYAVQFIALEFFFRGFLIHGTKRRFGAYAILVSMIPYCLIHFQKPFPEALGSVVAGVVLGFLSLRARSIWPGALLHVAVAWTMDACVLLHRSAAGS